MEWLGIVASCILRELISSSLQISCWYLVDMDLIINLKDVDRNLLERVVISWMIASNGTVALDNPIPDSVCQKMRQLMDLSNPKDDGSYR